MVGETFTSLNFSKIFPLITKVFINTHEYAIEIITSPEPKAQGELIVWDSSRRASVRLSVRASTLSNMNIIETSWPIIIKSHLEHHWGGGLAA